MWATSSCKHLRLFTAVIATILVLTTVLHTAQATSYDLLGGNLSVADSLNNLSNSNGTLEASARGSLFGSGQTNTITITNETTDNAQLSFTYSASGYNSFTVAGASASPSGSYSAVLNAGASVTVVFQAKSGWGAGNASISLSNFSLIVASNSSNVTIEFDSALGSVTAGGTVVSSGTMQEVSLTDGVALVATPNGSTFLGWIDAEGKVLSNAASYTLNPANDMTVKAVFVGANSKPWFGVGSTTSQSESFGLLNWTPLQYSVVNAITYLFDDLNTAASHAASNSTTKTVVLMNSGTLSADTYTIPTGVTLLIPFDSANTLYTTKAQSDIRGKSFVTPTAFRTLTMSSGANLIINGAVSLSAKTCYSQGGDANSGSPTGPVSFVDMKEGSTITVNSGGALYTYGYITGSGTVTVKSGSTVYECFQFMDGRGGSQMTQMKNEVFPLSQYYVQNIVVPLTLESGANEFVFTTVYMSSTEFPAEAQFIGSDAGLFRLTSGSLTKRYDGTTDRLIVEMNGNGSFGSISLDVGTTNINSANYNLGINGNITVILNATSQVSVNQDLVLLPGAEIVVNQNTQITLGKGYSLYVYDQDEWGTFCGTPVRTFVPITYAPGKTYTRTEADLKDAKILVNGTLDASAGYLYTTEGGANITSDGGGVVKMKAGEQTITHQLVQGGNPEYPEIPIKPAYLKNGDGNYVQSTTGTYTYCGECLQWLTSHGNATNVELGNSLNMYFAFWSSSITEESKDNYSVIITHTDAAGNKTTQKFDSDLWLTTTIKISDTEEQPAYVVPYKGLAAKQMGDTVQVTLYKSGTAMHTWTDSIQDYAMRMLEKYEADENKGTLRTLLVDMLNYGAACQKVFGYDTENPVNAGLSDEQQKEWATSQIVWSTDMPNGNTSYEANLIVDSNIRFAISNVDRHLSYTFMNHWDKDRGGDLLYDEAGKYYYVSKLYVADARQKISITVNETTTVEDSVEAYCYRMIIDEGTSDSQKAVCTAFMKFSNSAYNYLHDDEVNRV